MNHTYPATDIILIIGAIFAGISSLLSGWYGYQNSKRIKRVDKNTDGRISELSAELKKYKEIVIGLTDVSPTGSYRKVKTQVEADKELQKEIKTEIEKTENSTKEANNSNKK